MAQFQLDESKFSCSICIDLLKQPVTIPCGHSYCMSCIENHWNVEDFKMVYSCPECRQTFKPRPVLRKNTVLAGLVEDMKKPGDQEAQNSDCSAGPGDVACDFCTGRKLKAIKSCLQCLVSYCELHLQPHYESPTFQKHRLVEASPNIQENICSLHNSVKEIFCRTDQQLICYHCSEENHQGHNTISAVTERTRKQEELVLSHKLIRESIQNREAEIKLLNMEVEAINTSADKADQDSQTNFNHLLQLLKMRTSEVQQTIRSNQKIEVTRAEKLQEKLQQEMTDLRRKDVELEKLLHTEDNNQFLLKLSSLSSLNTSSELPNITIRSPTYFEKLMAAVSEVTQKFYEILKLEWTNISQFEVDVLLTRQDEDLNLLQGCLLDGAPKILPFPPVYLTRDKAKTLPPPDYSSEDPEPQKESTILQSTPAHSSTDDFKMSPLTTISRSRNGSSGSLALYPFQQESECSTVYSIPEGYCLSPSGPTHLPQNEPVGLQSGSLSTESKSLPPAPINQPRRESIKQPTTQDNNLPSEINPSIQEKPLSSAPVYLSPHEPKTTTDFLQYSCQITLDPNTMNKSLTLSGENRRVTRDKKKQWHFNHAERFADRFQVLSRESLTGRCYWEVEWDGIVSIAVSYNNINRKGQESGFGDNEKSWALYCHNNKFIHNRMCTVLTSSPSSRVGVYLDYRAGILCFYSVSETRTLLHRVQARFSHPLHAGLCVSSGSAEILQLL
ncbi:tripartite motif-containing protein 16-like [Oryzias melastigma]|uniref:tripartite motif-containing protein 16-like n=1 Tax=Oryzias melastigma TaxID=30732 RepID=UPI00168D7B00|nr:tripartite motif-containing protein 16-like [Oryzias melastigma]